MFERKDFDTGRAGTFSVGIFDQTRMKEHFINPGTPSAMKIPDGVTVQLFTGGFFDGNNIVIAGPYTS